MPHIRGVSTIFKKEVDDICICCIEKIKAEQNDTNII